MSRRVRTLATTVALALLTGCAGTGAVTQTAETATPTVAATPTVDATPTGGSDTWDGAPAQMRYVAWHEDGDAWRLHIYELVDGAVRDTVIPGVTQPKIWNGVGDVDISSDGRYVAFFAQFDGVAGDANGAGDVFLYDRETGEIELASVTNGPRTADDWARGPRVSDDGRYVFFLGKSEAFVGPEKEPEGYFGDPHIIRRDMTSGTSEVVDRRPDGSLSLGAWLDAISADGTIAVFNSSDWSIAGDLDPSDIPFHEGEGELYALDNFGHAYREDLTTGAIVRLDAGLPWADPEDLGLGVEYKQSSATAPRLSSDGNVALFQYDLFDFIEHGDNDSPGWSGAPGEQLYVYDASTGDRSLVFDGSAYGPGQFAEWRHHLSGNGATVVGAVPALDCSDGCPSGNYLYGASIDLDTADLPLTSVTADILAEPLAISFDGRYVAVRTDRPGEIDSTPRGDGFQLYFLDRATGVYTWVASVLG